MQHTKNNFDGVRLIAALMVLVIHQLAQQGIGDINVLIAMGVHAVSIFFGISGYLVSESWLRDPNPARFAARRLLRIWPALVAVVLVLSACVWANPLTPDFLRYAVFYGFDGAFFPNTLKVPLWNPGLDVPLWTIELEVICYLLVIVAGKIRWLGLIIAALFVLGFGHPLLGLASTFAAGAAVRFFPRNTCLLLALAGSIFSPEIAIGVLAVLLGQQSWPVLRDAAKFGDLSYGSYLWAWPITQLGIVLFGDRWWLMALTLAATGVMAWLSWHLIESPALRLKPSRPSS